MGLSFSHLQLYLIFGILYYANLGVMTNELVGPISEKFLDKTRFFTWVSEFEEIVKSVCRSKDPAVR